MDNVTKTPENTTLPNDQRAVDALYLLGLDSRLKSISAHLDTALEERENMMFAIFEAHTELDQLRITIGKDILREMQEQEAADDSEMPLGTGYTNG